MATKIHMKADAKAVLFARGYRFTCPQCNALNVEDIPVYKVVCSQCQAVFSVQTVYFVNGKEIVAPGINCRALDIASLFLAEAEQKIADTTIPGFEEANTASLPEVDLVATGYIWACPECDAWANHPHLESRLVSEVRCKRCRAQYPVVEITHKIVPSPGVKTLLGHAVVFETVPDEETESPNNLPSSGGADKPIEHQQDTGGDLVNWSFFGGADYEA
ncbi:hypothetical protein KQH40_00770 [bacterium]|nr:hypothetical protein [bacterium]